MEIAVPDTALAQADTQVQTSSATGHYTDKVARITFNHVRALSLDSTDGQVDPDVKMRIVLADREVPAEALMGGEFPPVRAMARAGDVRGVMLEFDPADRTKITLTPLLKPADPIETLATVSLFDSTGLWQSLSATPGHISGHLAHGDTHEIDATFDAPVTTNAVVSILNGSQAQSSELVSILKQRTRAYVDGDRATFIRLSSRESVARSDAEPIPKEQIQAYAAAIFPLIDKAKQVVTREHTAVVIMPDGLVASFVKEDGSWKCAD